MCYCTWCAALVLLDVVGSGCGALRCRLQHVSGIIMPIFRRTRRVLLHVVCCAGSAGCGWCSNTRLVLLKMGIMMPETC